MCPQGLAPMDALKWSLAAALQTSLEVERGEWGFVQLERSVIRCVLSTGSCSEAPLIGKEKTTRRNDSLVSLLSVLSFHESEQVPAKSWLVSVMLRAWAVCALSLLLFTRCVSWRRLSRSHVLLCGKVSPLSCCWDLGRG